MNLTIIGAGPIGCYCGYLLAKSGHQVDIYERKAQIGKPIQCTGIITADLDQFGFDLNQFLVNTINQIDVFTPNKSLSVKQKDYIVCRHKFDDYLANLARKEGVKIHLNHSFLRKEGDNIVIKDKINNQEITLKPQIIIAADGPLSPTAKAYDFYHPQRKHYYGIQATVEGNFEPGTVQTYFGNQVCPGMFVWVVPESSTIARVGLAARKNSKYYFDKFMREKGFNKEGFQIKEMQAGTIPLYHPRQRLKKGNCYLIGDASGYVKAITLGGVVPGLKQAQILVKCLNEGKDYQKEIRPVLKHMEMSLYLRRIFNRFSDQDWDKLVSYVNQEKVQKLLLKHTRDQTVPLVSKVLMTEPRFLLLFGKSWLKDPGMIKLTRAFF